MRLVRQLLGGAAVTCASCCACSGSGVEPSIESEPVQMRVVATVERQSLSGQAQSQDLSVLLSILRMPQSVNGDRLLRLMGLHNDLPAIGACEVIDLANRSSPSLSSMERVEFLDVGEVTVTSGKRSLRLARQAFPTVTDFISGVIYTSRDRNADLLPLDSRLSLSARGSGRLKGFALEVGDIPPLEKVTLDNAPLAAQSRISAADPFELHWQPGAAGDLLWVEFGANAGRKTVSCVFDDDAGSATIPGGMTDEQGEARITLHRLHQDEISIAGFDRAEIRFDSRLSQVVLMN